MNVLYKGDDYMNQVKRIPTHIVIHEYLFTFEYLTWKGFKRKIDKRTIKSPSVEDAKILFKNWWQNIRTISKAEILDIKEIEENKQEIVL